LIVIHAASLLDLLRALPVRRRAGIAFAAIENGAKFLCPSFRRNDPGTIGPGRIVAHVLVVAASEFRHPVKRVILVKSGNALVHEKSCPLSA
jgi:hypothetical protein